MRKISNKYLFLFIIFAVLFIIVEIVLKQQVEKYALHENNEKLENILINQKALHKYVENIQKPVIYNLKKTNERIYRYSKVLFLNFRNHFCLAATDNIFQNLSLKI